MKILATLPLLIVAFGAAANFSGVTTNPVASSETADDFSEATNALLSLKDVNEETLIIIDCENVLFKHIDTAFVYENAELWSRFQQQRKLLDPSRDRSLDFVLLNSPKKVAGENVNKVLQSIREKGGRILLLLRLNNDKFKYEDSLRHFFEESVSFMLRGVTLSWESEVAKQFGKGILFTNDQEVSSYLINVAKTARKDPSVKRVIFIGGNSPQIEDPSVEVVGFTPKNAVEKLSDDLLEKQFKILLDSGEWLADDQLRAVSKLPPDQAVIELCKRSVLEVCACKEINEWDIYKKIAVIVGDDYASSHRVESFIDDFQEVKSNLDRILKFTGVACLWEVCMKMGLSPDLASQVMENIKSLDFDKNDVEAPVLKILPKKGCGVHWKDKAKYLFIKERLLKQDGTNPPDYHTERYANYEKVIEVVLEELVKNLPENFLENTVQLFIQELRKNNVDKKKISEFENEWNQKKRGVLVKST